MFEFLVDAVTPEWIVTGRNGDKDIPAGTTFTAIRRVRVHKEGSNYRSEDLGVVGRVSLEILRVHFYSHIIDQVPGGHSAGLALAGEGFTELRRLLAELPPGDWLYLVADEREHPG